MIDFQDAKYAGEYLDKIHRFAALKGVDGALVRELARHLAVRMSSEDVIRVAQLKLRASRLARVEAEARARPGDMFEITEFLKPVRPRSFRSFRRLSRAECWRSSSAGDGLACPCR